MIFGLSLLFIIWVAWMLLVEGYLWKGILFFAGWIGLRLVLPVYVPWTAHDTTILSHPITWAAVIATTICFLALMTTKD